jgi:rhodanese-related sulfurtransferase
MEADMAILTQKQMNTADPSQVVDSSQALEHFRDKITFTTGPVELSHWMEDKMSVNIVDVRDAEDYAKGHIPGAVNLPRDRWDTYEGLQKDRNNVLYCYTIVCHLAATAAVQFAGKGYPVIEMDGGFRSWQEHGLKIVK